MKIMKILLLGGGLQCLSFGESLFKCNGYELSVVSDEYDIRRCRFFKKVYAVHHLGYETILKEILSKEHYDVIVPMGDIPVKFLSRHKEAIERDYQVRCSVVNEDTLSIVADKSRFMEFCKDNGFPHPRTAAISEGSLDSVAREVGFPSLIKPDFSMGARGITQVNSIEDLKTQYPQIHQKYGSCTLQEFIDNPDYYYNVMLYRDSKGNCYNSVVIKIVRMYPIKAGSSCCCVSVENQELVDVCKKVLDILNWRGMADFDVLQRKDTMEYKIIEINPRVPASLRAAYISGVNYPKIIAADEMNQQIVPQDYSPGKIMRYMGLDLMWFLKSPQRFSTSPSWFKFMGKKIYYQDIILSDFSTWYSWLITGLMKLLKR